MSPRGSYSASIRCLAADVAAEISLSPRDNSEMNFSGFFCTTLYHVMLPLPYSAAVVSQPVNTCMAGDIWIKVEDKGLQILWMEIYFLLSSTHIT